MAQPTLVVELTASGARDTDRYREGQRLVLPEQTAKWFAERGWAILLDDPDDAA